jgi:hypothetical protein
VGDDDEEKARFGAYSPRAAPSAFDSPLSQFAAPSAAAPRANQPWAAPPAAFDVVDSDTDSSLDDNVDRNLFFTCVCFGF